MNLYLQRGMSSGTSEENLLLSTEGHELPEEHIDEKLPQRKTPLKISRRACILFVSLLVLSIVGNIASVVVYILAPASTGQTISPFGRASSRYRRVVILANNLYKPIL